MRCQSQANRPHVPGTVLVQSKETNTSEIREQKTLREMTTLARHEKEMRAWVTAQRNKVKERLGIDEAGTDTIGWEGTTYCWSEQLQLTPCIFD